MNSESEKLADHIRTQPTAAAATEAAAHLQNKQRRDWMDVRPSIMDAVLEAKFEQHPALRTMLLSTGDRQLVYDYRVRCCSFRIANLP